MGFGLWVVAAGLLGAAALSVKEVAASRSLEAALYPPLSVLLALTFTVNLGYSLIKMQIQEPELRRPLLGPDGTPFARSRKAAALIVAVLIVGVAVRLYNVGNMPEWQLDEITYWSIGRQLVLYHSLNVPLAYQQVWQPFVYHPPFYLWLLADWYHMVGVGITQSRVLGVVSEMFAFGLLSRLLARLYGIHAAAFATTLMVFDGWMLYVGRISYIENTCLVIMMTGLLLFARAMRTGTMPSYFLAGAVIGFAGVYNNDAAYLVPVIVLHWLMSGRRDTREHVAAVASALAMFVLYAALMSILFTVSGKNWWWHDTYVQLRRVTGGQASAGTVSNPMQVFTLITKQYALFLPSLSLTLASAFILMRRLAYCARLRDWSPLGPERLLPAWTITALVIFGGAGLHFSQYFVMFLLPAYSYLWVNMWPWLAVRPRATIAAVMSAVVLVGCGTAVLRLRQDSNAFRSFQQYAATQIPKNDLVIAGTAGDPLAYLVNQRWCSPSTTISPECFGNASYLITWRTYLQPANPLNLWQLTVLLAASKDVATFHQFSGSITVCKIDRSLVPKMVQLYRAGKLRTPITCSS
jgi:4-amino-4-deoxy-L-arabinose transferase-like glycosyltransferase